jgi:hypothetical protein
MCQKIAAFFVATLIAVAALGVAGQAEAQQGTYWNGAPSSGYGTYPWEQGGNWNRGDWSHRHYRDYQGYQGNRGQPQNPQGGGTRCSSGSGGPGSVSGVTVCQ